jgi:hypothetical protein
MHLLSANSRRWRDRYAFENSIRISAPCGTPFRPATRPHVAGGERLNSRDPCPWRRNEDILPNGQSRTALRRGGGAHDRMVEVLH